MEVLSIRGCFRLWLPRRSPFLVLRRLPHGLESEVILPGTSGGGYRSLGSIPSGTNVPAKAFARFSPGPRPVFLTGFALPRTTCFAA